MTKALSRIPRSHALTRVGGMMLSALLVACGSDDTTGTGGSSAGGSGGSGGSGAGNVGGNGGAGNAGNAGGAGGGGAEPVGYPFEGYTSTRGAFEAIEAEATDPRILIVDRLSADPDDGDEPSGRGSLPWALAQGFPRVVLFEISGVIDVGGSLPITSPYVSVHGQTAPAPGITLHNVELFVHTHDVILQHLRVRMGETELGGGDAVTICGGEDESVHDIIIDHCSAALAHDEQLSMSACATGAVRRVTLSSNIIAFGLNYAGHAYGTLIESGDNNDFDVDEILVWGNLYANVSYRTPMVNSAARHVTVANNVTYNAEWHGMMVATLQFPEGQYIDMLNNLYWRGPETEDAGTWPTDEVDSWPSQPDLWPSEWNENRQPVSGFEGTSGSNTHVYYEGNYDYVNAEDYAAGNHEGRPVELADQRYYDGEVTAEDVTETTRQTSLDVRLMTPVELEAHVQLSVGPMPEARDPLDALAVSDAWERTGGYIDYVGDLSVSPVAEGSDTRALTSIAGYPSGTELEDGDGNGLTELEEWLYGL